MMAFAKSFSGTSAPSAEPNFQTLFAHFSNSVSWVTPRSSEIASNSVFPGDLRLVLGSPPSRCLTTSVVRFRAPTLDTPATYRPSHLTRNLKFLYGSNRVVLTVNCGGGIGGSGVRADCMNSQCPSPGTTKGRADLS